MSLREKGKQSRGREEEREREKARGVGAKCWHVEERKRERDGFQKTFCFVYTTCIFLGVGPSWHIARADEYLWYLEDYLCAKGPL